MKNRTMIERIARRLCSLDGHPEEIAFEGAPMRQSYIDTARAVLIAMREPTPGIVRAWTTRRGGHDGPPASWSDLIDVALAEKL